MKVIAYRLVTANDADDLNKQIGDLLLENKGWEPINAPVFTNAGQCAQAMVIPASRSDKADVPTRIPMRKSRLTRADLTQRD